MEADHLAGAPNPEPSGAAVGFVHALLPALVWWVGVVWFALQRPLLVWVWMPVGLVVSLVVLLAEVAIVHRVRRRPAEPASRWTASRA